MKFRKLSLYTNNLESEFQFYANTLGFEVVESGPTRFSVKVGWSQLSFAKSESEHKYHYCFLIPSNQLDQALDWVEKRTEVIIIEKNKKIQNFKTWNADSFYFNDASGNLAEFIVRHDLNNSNSSSFDLPMALGINEIGMPTTDISNTNNQLVTEIDSKFWKGDYERFGTNGNLDGMLLLPNTDVKKVWFPTTQKITVEPFEAEIENNGTLYKLKFQSGKLKTSVAL